MMMLGVNLIAGIGEKGRVLANGITGLAARY